MKLSGSACSASQPQSATQPQVCAIGVQLIASFRSPRSSGLTALTSVDQTDQFDLTMTVRVIAVSGDNLHRGSAEATVKRSQTISEKTTPAERDGVWYDMTQQAMNEINAKLESKIDQNLAWFKQTPN